MTVWNTWPRICSKNSGRNDSRTLSPRIECVGVDWKVGEAWNSASHGVDKCRFAGAIGTAKVADLSELEDNIEGVSDSLSGELILPLARSQSKCLRRHWRQDGVASSHLILRRLHAPQP